jgi:hypothetical protein
LSFLKPLTPAPESADGWTCLRSAPAFGPEMGILQVTSTDRFPDVSTPGGMATSVLRLAWSLMKYFINGQSAV